MALSFAQQLVNLGVPVAQAKEIASQVETGVYNKQRLVWSGMPPALASVVVELPFNQIKAISLGMPQPVASIIAGGGYPLEPFDYLDGYWPGGDLSIRRNLAQYTEDIASNRYAVTSATKQTDTVTVQVNGQSVVLTRVTAANFYSSLRSPYNSIGYAPFVIGARYLVSCFVVTPDVVEGTFWQRFLTNGGSQGFAARLLRNKPRRVWTLMQATTTTQLDPGPVASTDLGGTAGTDPYWFFKGNAPGLPATTEVYTGGFMIERVADGYDDGIAALGSSIYQQNSGPTDAQNSISMLRWMEALRNCTVFNRGVAGNNSAAMLTRYDTDIPPIAPRCRYGLFEVCNPNDVGNSSVLTLQQIKDNALAIRDKFIASGLIPVITTGTPFSQTGSQETKRRDVNEWAKYSGEFEKVIDLATGLANPNNLSVMQSAYVTGPDFTHPNAVGTRAAGIILASSDVWDLTEPTPYQKIATTTYP